MILAICSIAQMVFAEAHLMPADARMDPPGSDIHMAYESDTFTPGKVYQHLPGTALAAPGDTYRITLMRKDRYANDPTYEVVKAIVGIHIDDYDWNPESGDGEREWGKLLINGQAMTTVKSVPWDSREPQSSGFLEIASDAEISQPNGPLIPPYVFDVTEHTSASKWLSFEVVNVREDGSESLDGDSEFGNFVVNRIGYHVWYKKKR